MTRSGDQSESVPALDAINPMVKKIVVSDSIAINLMSEGAYLPEYEAHRCFSSSSIPANNSSPSRYFRTRFLTSSAISDLETLSNVFHSIGFAVSHRVSRLFL